MIMNMSQKNNNTLKKIVQSITKYYTMRYKDVAGNDADFEKISQGVR